MRWQNKLMLLRNLLQSDISSWVFVVAGALIALLLHRKDKKCRLWPALAAVVLCLACEFTGQNIRSYGIELLALFIGFAAIGCAAGWLVMDVIYLLKKDAGSDNSGRKRTLTVTAVMLLLAVLLVLACFLRKKEYPASYDLEKLESLGLRGVEYPLTLGETYYVPYKKMNARAFDDLLKGLEISDPAKIGKVVAYSAHHPRQWYYYCTVEGLDGDWLLMFDEDGTGIPGAKNVVYLYGTEESVEHAPDWVKRLHGR